MEGRDTMKKSFITVAALSLFIVGGTFTSANSTNEIKVAETNFEESRKVAEVEPQAIPAIVGGAFLAGVAYKAGTKATSWALDKLLGNNDEKTSIKYQESLDVVFD
jgi:hypothetical protein